MSSPITDATVDPAIRAVLAELGLAYEVMVCDPELADTAVFCEHYGHSLEDSVNTIIVKAKTAGERFVACVLLAHTRLDVNKSVRKRLGARRVSFASAEETRRMTGMEIGGVTPVGLPETLPMWVDSRVMDRERVILGAGTRRAKIVVPPALFRSTPATEIVEGLAYEPARS